MNGNHSNKSLKLVKVKSMTDVKPLEAITRGFPSLSLSHSAVAAEPNHIFKIIDFELSSQLNIITKVLFDDGVDTKNLVVRAYLDYQNHFYDQLKQYESKPR